MLARPLWLGLAHDPRRYPRGDFEPVIFPVVVVDPDCSDVLMTGEVPGLGQVPACGLQGFCDGSVAEPVGANLGTPCPCPRLKDVASSQMFT